MKYLWSFFVLVLQFELATSQMDSAKDSLRFWGDAMISLRASEFRNMARTEFLRLARLNVRENSDSTFLDFHPSIVKSSSSDGQLTIYSWSSEVAQNRNLYFCYLFIKKQAPMLLVSRERNYKRINYEEFSTDNWYGALYYHVLADTFSSRYFLLGFANSPDGTKHRIIEPLYTSNGKITFGAPLFVKKDEKDKDEYFHRIIIHYSPSAHAVVQYDPTQKQILYDHISNLTDIKSGEALLIPDGTMEAFEWDGKIWKHNPYLKNEILESAPVDKPLFNSDSKSRDILGRKKSK